ncbi:hypothetical protein DFJ74DRAFT_764355, partial [Hyaloraphidium curvatum]
PRPRGSSAGRAPSARPTSSASTASRWSRARRTVRRPRCTAATPPPSNCATRVHAVTATRSEYTTAPHPRNPPRAQSCAPRQRAAPTSSCPRRTRRARCTPRAPTT